MAGSVLLVDESGDLGIGKGTDWFVLAGVLVDKSDEPEIRNTLRRVRQKINVNEIHFRKMSSFDKKSYVTSELSKCTFEYITIVANTSMIKLNGTGKNSPGSILSYNHMCRFLIERASWLLRDTERRADVILSSRGTSRDGELIDYIRKVVADPVTNIEDRFDKITAKPASSWDLLQLADVCATSMFNMFQKNGLGFITPCFTYRLKGHLYRHNGKTLRYGIKYYDETMGLSKEYFREYSPCRILPIEKAPGTTTTSNDAGDNTLVLPGGAFS